MPKPIPEAELHTIEAVLAAHPEGMSIQHIERALADAPPRRTLQYRLKHLVAQGRVLAEGEKRWVRYRLPAAAETGAPETVRETPETVIPLSRPALEIQRYIRQPPVRRRPVGYNRAFLDRYQPNVSHYLSRDEIARLKAAGQPVSGGLPAGTYARQLLNRLLIDLSWNSSRLEGNTYSLLDTRRLIDFGEEAAGKQRLEAQMILNHKDAIEFLVGSAGEAGFNRHTLLNLHALLANNLLTDPEATGRLRRIAIGIEQSVFHPLEVPQLIEECFDRILATADAIVEPFEQSFFVMVHLPYLQPFDDVNKRVSRLAANIPLIRANLAPLSFIDVPAQTYTEAILGVYELNRVEMLKDVFLWAYERSAMRYAAVRQSLGEPDPFRLTYRDGLREVVMEIVRGRMNRKQAFAHIASWAGKNVEAQARERFREVAETEVLSLHEGNFARYRLTPAEFQAWRQRWTQPARNDS